MLSVSFAQSVDYLQQRPEVQSIGADALMSTQPIDTPGRWIGSGAASLGLVGDVDRETMARLVKDRVHPTTGTPLGSPQPTRSVASQLAAAIAAEGGSVEPERVTELRLQIARAHRATATHVDVNFTLPESWAGFHADLRRAGRHQDAAKVWTAISEGNDQALGYFREHAAFVKAGARWLDATDWITAMFPHHRSHQGAPRLHIHTVIVNWVPCSDGQWHPLDPQTFDTVRPAAEAMAERAAKWSLGRSLNVRL